MTATDDPKEPERLRYVRLDEYGTQRGLTMQYGLTMQFSGGGMTFDFRHGDTIDKTLYTLHKIVHLLEEQKRRGSWH